MRRCADPTNRHRYAAFVGSLLCFLKGRVYLVAHVMSPRLGCSRGIAEVLKLEGSP
jgi:hypothetical protein